MPTITLREIDRHNWRAALALRVHPDQQRFVAGHAPIAALVLAKAYVRAGGLVWVPYLIEADADPIGLLALAHRPDCANDCWLCHFFVDQGWQERGYGRQALRALIALLPASHPDCRRINLTVHPANAPAQRLYTAAGFRPTGEVIEGELVFQLTLAKP